MRIVIAVDESTHSQRAVDLVQRLRWPAGSCVLVVTALPSEDHSEGTPASASRDSSRANRGATEARLTQVQDGLRAIGVSSAHRILEGDPREALIRLIEAEHVDLLVLGSRGRLGLLHVLLGSVSSHAVSHAGCSVLVVKGPFKPAVEVLEAPRKRAS